MAFHIQINRNFTIQHVLQNVSLFDLVQMCLDVAKGKAFLLALIQYSIITSNNRIVGMIKVWKGSIFLSNTFF